MTSPQCKTTDNEFEIILCQVPAQCVEFVAVPILLPHTH